MTVYVTVVAMLFQSDSSNRLQALRHCAVSAGRCSQFALRHSAHHVLSVEPPNTTEHHRHAQKHQVSVYCH